MVPSGRPRMAMEFLACILIPSGTRNSLLVAFINASMSLDSTNSLEWIPWSCPVTPSTSSLFFPLGMVEAVSCAFS